MSEQNHVTQALGRQINAYLAKAAGNGGVVASVGPFTASADPNDSTPFRNYAIPASDAAPRAGDVADLVTWYKSLERKPRLEFVSEAAAAVEPALLAAGFEVEGRLALMTLGENGVQPTAIPAGIELLSASEEADLRNAAKVQNEAYDAGDVTDADVARLKRNVDHSGAVVCARDILSGQIVGAGLYTPAHAGVTEIAGVGVSPAFRRRGVAAALTAKLAESALSRGIDLPFITPDGVREQRIYERVGFEVRMSILHISLPSKG
jgi:ribosomal protein S18 acetylase RimI-like enzyme